MCNSSADFGKESAFEASEHEVEVGAGFAFAGDGREKGECAHTKCGADCEKECAHDEWFVLAFPCGIAHLFKEYAVFNSGGADGFAGATAEAEV